MLKQTLSAKHVRIGALGLMPLETQHEIMGDIDTIALFLDVDGTLLEIAPSPELVHVPSWLPGALAKLSVKLNGALAILSGRRITDVDQLFHPLKIPSAGVHGAEMRWRLDGPIDIEQTNLPPEFIIQMLELKNQFPGVQIEIKGSGLSVHYREASSAASSLEVAIANVVKQSHKDVCMLAGRQVFEILPKGVGKGAALAKLSQIQPFASRRPIMIGDDIGDVSAFHEAKRRGGLGLKVQGETFAHNMCDLDGPAAVHQLLQSIMHT